MAALLILATSLAALAMSAAAAPRGNGDSKKPPMGWTTWCTDPTGAGAAGGGTCGGLLLAAEAAAGKPKRPEICTDSEVRSVALAMKAEGMLDAGWDRINLDDCWSSQDRDAKGWLVPVPERFPHGMKDLVDFVHGLGFKMGLYLSGGRETCRGQIGSYGYYRQDAAAYDAWRVDYVKEDWCDAGGLDLRAEIQKRATALKAVADNRTFWYQCPCTKSMKFDCWDSKTGAPPAWIGELCDSWRFFNDHHDNWGSTSSIIEALAVRAPFNAPGQWNDAVSTTSTHLYIQAYNLARACEPG